MLDIKGMFKLVEIVSLLRYDYSFHAFFLRQNAVLLFLAIAFGMKIMMLYICNHQRDNESKRR